MVWTVWVCTGSCDGVCDGDGDFGARSGDEGGVFAGDVEGVCDGGRGVVERVGGLLQPSRN